MNDTFVEQYWDNIARQSRLYGADVKTSIIDRDDPHSWNLNNLQTVLSDGLDGMTLAGITTPYLYVGGFGTTFAWHTEDLDMSSINFLHYGATKLWYIISPADARKFQACLKHKYPEAFLECPQYFRHKTIVANPYQLLEQIPGINISKIEQTEGDFVLTFGTAYHQGFNFGFNVAESVNFATPSWLPEFPKFSACRCHKDNLRIEPKTFCERLQKSQLTRT